MSLAALIDKHNTSKFGLFTTDEIIRAGAYAHRTLNELSVGDPAMAYFLREFQTFQVWIGAKIELGYTPVEPCLVFSHSTGLTPEVAEECIAVAKCYGGQAYFSELPKSVILKGAAAKGFRCLEASYFHQCRYPRDDHDSVGVWNLLDHSRLITITTRRTVP